MTGTGRGSEADQTGGRPPLEGYFYQLDISVWAALDLLLVKKRATQLVLEPVGDEDLEADLDADAPGAIHTAADLGPVQLIVQAKLRNTGPWSLTALKNLLAHGKRRKSAKERLELAPRARYLLVTSADLAAGDVRDLKVGGFGLWPKSLPSGLGLDAKDVGRFGVIAAEDPWKVKRRLRELLEDTFIVPHAKFEPCLKALQDLCLDRMRGVAGGLVTRDQIAQIIRTHDGAITGSLEFERYVPPTNWRALKETLVQYHAIVLTGASGTGKTTTAEALAQVFRRRTPGASIVTIRSGPDEVRADRTPEPVIFMIEDPWGKYRFEPTAQPWNDELPRLLESASANRRFIITSRTDVLQDSKAKALPSQWISRLEAEDYGPAQRVALFERRLPGLPDPLQLLVDQRRSAILADLATPFEIQRFFDAVRDGRSTGETVDVFIRRCIQDAHQDMIEQTVVRQVHQRDASDPAVILWGLLKARPKLSRAALQAVEAELGILVSDLEDQLEPLTNFFVAARNFRLDDLGVSYAHPRIEAALEQVARQQPNRTARLLGTLTQAMVALEDTSSGDWWRESAALMLQAAHRAEIVVRAPDEARQKLDLWLEEEITRPSAEFRSRLKLAAEVGRSPAAKVAHWLTNISAGRVFANFPAWSPDPDDDDWYAARAADTATAKICDRFLREVLPLEHDDYPKEFRERLSRLAPDLTPAYRAAARAVVGYGYNSNAELIAEGALADLDGFEDVARAAIEVLAAEALDGENDWLSVRNGEYSDDYVEFLAERQSEDGYTADSFLKAFVSALRAARGWTAVRNHPLVDGLLYAWIDELRRSDTEVSADELIAIGALTANRDQEARFWSLASDHWTTDLYPQLQRRLLEGSADWRTRASAAACLAFCEDQTAALIGGLEAQGRLDRLAELMLDLAEDAWPYETRPPADLVRSRVQDAVSPEFGEALRALNGSQSQAPISQGVQRTLQGLNPGQNPRLRHQLGVTLTALGLDATAHIDALLAAPLTDDDRAIAGAVWAVSQLAARPGLDGLRLALAHGYADVRIAALQAIAARLTNAVPTELLAMASDKGSGVRRALLDLLETRPHANHLPTLVVLANDTWSPSARYYGEETNNPLAVRAAKLLATSEEIPADLLPNIVEAAKTAEDAEVPSILLRAMAGPGGRPGRSALMDMVLDRSNVLRAMMATQALFDATNGVEADIVQRIPIADLTQRRAPVTVELALLMGAYGPHNQVTAAGLMLSGHPSRSALSIPLFAGACFRTDDAAADILKLLPSELAAALQRTNRTDEKLARSVVPAGDVRISEAVTTRMRDFFAVGDSSPGRVAPPG